MVATVWPITHALATLMVKNVIQSNDLWYTQQGLNFNWKNEWSGARPVLHTGIYFYRLKRVQAAKPLDFKQFRSTPYITWAVHKRRQWRRPNQEKVSAESVLTRSRWRASATSEEQMWGIASNARAVRAKCRDRDGPCQFYTELKNTPPPPSVHHRGEKVLSKKEKEGKILGTLALAQHFLLEIHRPSAVTFVFKCSILLSRWFQRSGCMIRQNCHDLCVKLSPMHWVGSFYVTRAGLGQRITHTIAWDYWSASQSESRFRCIWRCWNNHMSCLKMKRYALILFMLHGLEMWPNLVDLILLFGDGHIYRFMWSINHLTFNWLSWMLNRPKFLQNCPTHPNHYKKK